MFRRSHHPASRLSNSEMKKLEQLFLMVDSCTVDMGGGSQDSATARQLADAINGYPNATIVYEVMRRVRKCFKASNPRVIIRALNLTDVLMQSCGAHVRREVGSEKFLKVICKLCKVTKTKLDPAWQTVAIRAQELLAGWAESSEQTLGSGNRFTQAYNNLRRDGVQFRNTSGVGIGGGGRGSMDARNSFRSSGGSFRGGRGGNFMGGSFRGGSGGSFRGGDSGGSFRGGSGGSFRGGDSGGSFRGGDNGDNLAGRSGSRSPGVGILQPGDLGYDEEAELAQAIMESSLSVTENGGQGGGHRRTDSLAAAAEDGDLLSMVPPTIEALMDIMESSRDLSELLDNDAAPDVVDQTRGLVEQVIKKVEELERDGNPDEKDMDRYLKAHDDLQTVLRVYEGVLDGKETLPLPNSDSGGAKNALGNGHRQNGSDDDESLVAGGISKGAKMPRSRGRGGETESDSGGRASPATGNLLDLEENAPLEAGAGGMLVAFDPGQFNATHIRGGSGSAAGFDSSSSVAQGSTTASNFPSETGAVYGSNAAASSTGGGGGGGDSGAGFAPTDLFASFGSAPGSDAPQAPDPNHAAIISVRTSSSRAPRKTPPSQQPSDFGSWMSSVRGVGSGGDPFAPSPASGYANGVGGRLPVVSESASFASSNGGGGSGSGGSNPFGTPQSMSSTRSGFPALDWQASAGQGMGQAATGPAVAAPKADSLDPFSVGYGARGSWTQSGSRSSTGGLGMRAHDGTLNSTSTSTSTSSATLASGSSAFSNFSSASPKQPVPAPPPMQQSLPQQQQQQPAMWWQHQPIQPQKAKQQRADPFGGSVLPVGGAGSGGGGIPSSFATGPFAQLTATSTGVSAGTGHSATGSGDSGAFSQALVVHEGMDGGMVGGDNGGRKKSNPFDDPSGTTFGVPQQQQPRSQQQQQQQPQPQQQQPQPQSQQQQQPRPQQQPQPQQQQQQQPRSQQHQPRPQQLRPQQQQPRPQQQQPRPQQQQQPRPQQQQPQPQSQQQQQPRPQQLRPQQQQSFHQVGQGYQQQPWSQQPQRRQSQQLLQVPFQQVNQQPQFQRHGQVNQQPQQQQQQQQPPQQPANRQHPNQHYV